MTRYEFIVSAEEGGERLDKVLGTRAELGSRSQVAKLIAGGAVLVDGVPRTKSHAVVGAEVVVVMVPEEPAPDLVPEAIGVPVVFEDESLLIVDKPAGMTVHPAPGHSSGTLVHALLGRGLAGGESFRPGVVHRLDKDTSGLLVVAKTADAHRRLVGMLRDRAIDRRYLALVHGRLEAETGTIEAPVGRDPVRRKTMSIGGSGAREARTHFRVLERLEGYTFVEVRLDTGRTHQIRVHFRGIGHPVAGDRTYGCKDPLHIGRQFLHSARLTLDHPLTGEHLDFDSVLPPDLAVALRDLRRATQQGMLD